jgi:hypothetical protein
MVSGWTWKIVRLQAFESPYVKLRNISGGVVDITVGFIKEIISDWDEQRTSQTLNPALTCSVLCRIQDQCACVVNLAPSRHERYLFYVWRKSIEPLPIYVSLKVHLSQEASGLYVAALAVAPGCTPENFYRGKSSPTFAAEKAGPCVQPVHLTRNIRIVKVGNTWIRLTMCLRPGLSISSLAWPSLLF